MVRALIEITDKTNDVLNGIKSRYGLKDKAQAIAFMASQFRDANSSGELPPMDPADPWMLAEDIPDMDFFFSRTWMTCFANNFEQPSGRAYKKILGTYRGYHLKFYFGEKDSFDVGENIVTKFMNRPAFAAEVNRGIIAHADKLRAFAQKTPTKNLDKLSGKELWGFFDQHEKIHSEYYQWSWIPVAADMFHNNLTNKLKERLKQCGVPDEKIEKYFVLLTQPTQKSLIQIEQDEFLSLAGLIRKDAHHRPLFERLFRQFQEQDVAKFGYKTHTKEYEALLEQRAGELISKIKPFLLKKIQNHYLKYFYVNHMWVGKANTFEYYLKELVKLIATHADVDRMLKEAHADFEKGILDRKKLIKKLELSEGLEMLFTEFGNFMVTKIYRRFAQIYALYKMEFLQEEVARRFEISLMQVRFMTPLEFKNALLAENINKAELVERAKFCVYYAEKGKELVFTGLPAEQFAAKLSKVELAEVIELRGQIGCLGKATGTVKIVTRPKDMEKMRHGDILVSIATDPDIVSAMKKAAAIVTEQGGVTSHAAIVSRELKIPCVIGTKIATRVLKDGDIVEVDANKGIVKILKRS